MEIALFLAAVFVYFNGLFSEFVFDDIFAIVDNADVVEGSQLLLTSDAFLKHDFWGQDIKSTTSHKSYRPLTTLSFRLMRILAQKLTGSSDLKVNSEYPTGWQFCSRHVGFEGLTFCCME